jgi:hypothetical protein
MPVQVSAAVPSAALQEYERELQRLRTLATKAIAEADPAPAPILVKLRVVARV